MLRVVPCVKELKMMHHDQPDPQPRVAVCFSGFVRNRTVSRNISDFWGSASYDAFIMTWRQQFELDLAPVVEGDAMCQVLRMRGFHRCASSLLDYDPAALYAATSDRCLVESRFGLYPHRTASMLFGVTRCMAAIREAQAASGKQYDFVVVTRFDVLDKVRPCGSLHYKKGCKLPQNQSNSMLQTWAELDELDLIANRGPVGWRRIEDRLMIGRTSVMARLEHVFANYTRDWIGGRRDHGGRAEEYLWQFWRRFIPHFGRLGDTAQHFDFPNPTVKSSDGFNPHRWSHCFFYRVVRALHLERADLLKMVSRFESAPRDQKCHSWVVHYAHDSSTSCHILDEKGAANHALPGLKDYEAKHSESVFMGNHPTSAWSPLSLDDVIGNLSWSGGDSLP